MSNNSRWYVIENHSRSTVRVIRKLTIISVTACPELKEVACPTGMTEVIGDGGDKRWVNTPLTPGFLYLRFDGDPRKLKELLKQDSSLCRLTPPDTLKRLSKEEVGRLGVLLATSVASDLLMKVGDKVLITAGPFEDHTGVVVGLDEKGKVTVELDVFNKGTPIEFDECQVLRGNEGE